MARWEALARPLTMLGQRLEAMIADPPDWLDGSARARVEGATASLSWRIDTLRAWISMLARAVGPVDADFVDKLGDGACDVAALVVNIGDDGNIHQPGFQLCLDFSTAIQDSQPHLHRCNHGSIGLPCN